MKKLEFKNLFIVILLILFSGCSSNKPLIDKKLTDLNVLDLFGVVIFIILLLGTFFAKDPRQRQLFESWLVIMIIMTVIGYCSYHLFN